MNITAAALLNAAAGVVLAPAIAQLIPDQPDLCNKLYTPLLETAGISLSTAQAQTVFRQAGDWCAVSVVSSELRQVCSAMCALPSLPTPMNLLLGTAALVVLQQLGAAGGGPASAQAALQHLLDAVEVQPRVAALMQLRSQLHGTGADAVTRAVLKSTLMLPRGILSLAQLMFRGQASASQQALAMFAQAVCSWEDAAWLASTGQQIVRMLAAAGTGSEAVVAAAAAVLHQFAAAAGGAVRGEPPSARAPAPQHAKRQTSPLIQEIAEPAADAGVQADGASGSAAARSAEMLRATWGRIVWPLVHYSLAHPRIAALVHGVPWWAGLVQRGSPPPEHSDMVRCIELLHRAAGPQHSAVPPAVWTLLAPLCPALLDVLRACAGLRAAFLHATRETLHAVLGHVHVRIASQLLFGLTSAPTPQSVLQAADTGLIAVRRAGARGAGSNPPCLQLVVRDQQLHYVPAAHPSAYPLPEHLTQAAAASRAEADDLPPLHSLVIHAETAGPALTKSRASPMTWAEQDGASLAEAIVQALTVESGGAIQEGHSQRQVVPACAPLAAALFLRCFGVYAIGVGVPSDAVEAVLHSGGALAADESGSRVLSAVAQHEEARYRCLQLVLALSEQVGAAVVRSAEHMLRLVHGVTQAQLVPGNDGEDASATIALCLGLVSAAVAGGLAIRTAADRDALRSLLPTLAELSTHLSPEIAEMASALQLAIASSVLGGPGESRDPASAPRPSYGAGAHYTSEDQVRTAVRDAVALLMQDEPAMKGGGVSQLADVLKHSLRAAWPMSLLQAVQQALMGALAVPDSFVYLPAMEAMALVMAKDADVAWAVLEAVCSGKLRTDVCSRALESLIRALPALGAKLSARAAWGVHCLMSQCVRSERAAEAVASMWVAVAGILREAAPESVRGMLADVVRASEATVANARTDLLVRQAASATLENAVKAAAACGPAEVAGLNPEMFSSLYRLASSCGDPAIAAHIMAAANAVSSALRNSATAAPRTRMPQFQPAGFDLPP